MSTINNVGGYNAHEQPVEYYKKNILKNLKSNSISNVSFDKKLKETSKNIQNKITGAASNKLINNSSLNKNNLSNQNGTDIAQLKEVAKQFTDQFYGLMWDQINERVNENPQGGFGEAMFQKSLWPELVKSASGNKLDKLGQAILNDLIKQEGYIEKNDIKQKK
ncbi:MAG: hypothetical protein EKK63_03010 [Acinetobacter sp.]|uniref:hypothetical protein n=1 Tax=Acinetobacter sp. TaxID=472 RepID=UPI000F9022EE|nr:hypothetical protein [Acinetobacter sp.]RUP42025.1 MAG: hypothetical protein EKK63_03010 [Acinetobacter sp.]